MDIQIDFSEIEEAVRRIGGLARKVPLGEFRLDAISAISIQLEHGIDVELSDVEINSGGLLGFQGHQVVLYIPDQGWRIEDVIDDGSKGKKVHVANCITLDEMKRRGRFERYVVRNGLSPDFSIAGKSRAGDEIEGQARLAVCMNCVKYLNYRNANNRTWNDRRNIVTTFSLDQFFATYSSYFKYMPQRNADEMRKDRYSVDWREESKKYRESIDWNCEGCAVNLSDSSHKKLLHVHHVNGVKGDDAISNLKALCIDCHSKEDMHQHLFVSHKDRRTIQRLRIQQDSYEKPAPGSLSESDWDEALRHADPAVHGLLYELQAQGFPVPEIGADVLHSGTQRVAYSNAELVWPDLKEVVVLQRDEDCSQLEDLGWTVFAAQTLLDSLLAK